MSAIDTVAEFRSGSGAKKYTDQDLPQVVTEDTHVYSSVPLFHTANTSNHTTGTSVTAANSAPHCIVDVNAGGAGTVVLATGAAIDAAYPNLPIGTSWIWYVQNNLGAAAAATLTASAGHTIDGDTTAAVADQDTAILLTRKTAAATYVTRSLGGDLTH